VIGFTGKCPDEGAWVEAQGGDSVNNTNRMIMEDGSLRGRGVSRGTWTSRIVSVIGIF